MVNERIKEYKETLENRERTYKAMSKTGRSVMYFGLLLLALSLFLFIPLSYGHVVSKSTAWYGWSSVFASGFFIILIGAAYNRSKGITPLYFSPDDEIFLEVFEALTSLETYKKEKLELAKHQCLKELNRVGRLIKYNWTLDDVRVVMKEIGDEIETFEKRFAKNLIFTLESGKEIENVHDILTEFGLYLIDPNKEKLISLNEKMDSLPHSDVTSHYAITDFKHHPIIKDFLIIGLILVFSLFSALFGFYYSHVSSDTSDIVFATIFTPLAAAYIFARKKR